MAQSGGLCYLKIGKDNKMKSKLITHLFLLGTIAGFSQPVVKHPNPSETLQKKYEWVTTEKLPKGFWVGYSVQVKMNENSNFFFGKWDSQQSKYYSTLESVISGNPQPAATQKELLKKEIERALEENEDDDTEENHESEKIVDKDYGILFHFYDDKVDFNEVDEIAAVVMNKGIDFDKDPIYWLGKSDLNQSVDFLISKYKGKSSDKTKENLIGLIGIHKNSEKVISFYKKVLDENGDSKIGKSAIFWIGEQDKSEGLEIIKSVLKRDDLSGIWDDAIFALNQMKLKEAESLLFDLARNSKEREVKKKALFWIGQKSTDEAAKLLKEVVYNETSDEIQKEAVFGISQLKKEKGSELLFEIAEKHPESEIRKQAIFWLSQKAGQKVIKFISNVAYNDRDIEIKKQAVFALAQLENNEGLDELVKLAKDHPSGQIRKEAIFWLSQKDDKRALDAIKDILKSEEN